MGFDWLFIIHNLIPGQAALGFPENIFFKTINYFPLTLVYILLRCLEDVFGFNHLGLESFWGFDVFLNDNIYHSSWGILTSWSKILGDLLFCY